MFRRYLLLAGVLLLICCCIAAAGLVCLPLLVPVSPFAEASRTVSESRQRRLFLSEVTVEPRKIKNGDFEIVFDSVWIERAAKEREIFGISVGRVPTDYFFLCFTLREGKEVFDREEDVMFFLDDRGPSFTSLNRTELFSYDIAEFRPGQKMRVTLRASGRYVSTTLTVKE